MGERRVSIISRSDIVRAIDVFQARGFAIGANRILANFKTFLRWCVERGLPERSPAEPVRAPSPEVSRDRVLSDEEIKAIWKATLTYAGPYGRIVRLLLLAAQRREEVAGMRWDELDLRSRAWTLRGNRTKSGRLPCGASQRSRYVRSVFSSSSWPASIRITGRSNRRSRLLMLEPGQGSLGQGQWCFRLAPSQSSAHRGDRHGPPWNFAAGDRACAQSCRYIRGTAGGCLPALRLRNGGRSGRRWNDGLLKWCA